MAEPVVDLTDDQIEQLLKDAEARLGAPTSGQNATSLTKPAGHEVAAAVPSSDANQTSTASPAVDEKSVESSEASIYKPQPRLSKKEMAAKATVDAGKGWFNLPKSKTLRTLVVLVNMLTTETADLTPQLKRDLQLLRMRDVLAQGKQHYKKDSSRPLIPEYSHVGTVVAGRTEWFNGRASKKEQKRSLLEQTLEQERNSKKFKSKYGDIQAAKTSGKKGHYKKMVAKRYKK